MGTEFFISTSQTYPEALGHYISGEGKRMDNTLTRCASQRRRSMAFFSVPKEAGATIALSSGWKQKDHGEEGEKTKINARK